MNREKQIKYLKLSVQALITRNGILYSVKEKKMCEVSESHFFRSFSLYMRCALAAYLSLDDLRLHETGKGVTRATGLVDTVLSNRKAVQKKRNLRVLAEV